jgi:heat-inducible transcriptional repressor
MAEMSEQGYLVQPHTSAGRIPTDRGYRYYVDCLVTPEDLLPPESLPTYDPSSLEVDEIVQQTCRLLSDMTQYISVASPPTVQTTYLHRLYLTVASSRHILLVMLLSTGHVEHRLLEVERTTGEISLQRVANFLNSSLAECDLHELSVRPLEAIPADLMPEQALIGKVHAGLIQAARSLTESRLFLEGTSHILRQREFQNVLLLERLLAMLEQKSVLTQVFDRAYREPNVMVIIGSESSITAIQMCSFVASVYHIGDRAGGFIGVLGPTRMRYDRAISAVSLMSRSLSTVLTHACLD